MPPIAKPFIFLTLFFFASPQTQSQSLILPLYPRNQEPVYLTFEELGELTKTGKPGSALSDKLEKFWKTPAINNEAFYNGVKPRPLADSRLGSFIRLASWNIEKSFNIADAIKVFSSATDTAALIKHDKDSKKYKEVLAQRAKLAEADILVLQEMDNGVKRSDYVNATKMLADALQMNYSFATEQLEIDPVVLGVDHILTEDGQIDTEAEAYYKADPEKYLGAFGVAVLSKYPIKRAESFQLKNQAYDWYGSEHKKITYLEKSRRFGAKTVFKNEVTREVKVGGRIFYRVDLHIPELPYETLTIINIHLEIKCQPSGRWAQMVEILSYIKDIKNPVILAGDFNSAPTDLSPTSVTRTATRTAKNPSTWLSVATSALVPNALVINASRFTSNLTKNFQDPTARSIPVIAPNNVKAMFNEIENFQFSDGGVFDFRGNKKRSTGGKKKTLANSNQRDRKGFKTTFSVKRPLGPVIGKYRLDWIFVKSFMKFDAHDKNEPYKFAPHFGQTLEELNTGLITPVSDHHPNIVDLPLEEPSIKN